VICGFLFSILILYDIIIIVKKKGGNMLEPKEKNMGEIDSKCCNKIYIIGGIAALVVLVGSLLDVFIGMSLGGDLTGLPSTAAGRFAQFKDNWLLGLYNLDLLNLITTLIMVPAFFALFWAHRKANGAFSGLAMTIFIIGVSAFVTCNTALPMYELSLKYAAADAGQQTVLLGAGESMLARGAHGSLGVFWGFSLILFSEMIMSLVMFTGKLFSKTNAIFGFAGSSLMLLYVILVTFVPAAKTAAMAVSAPGGILLIVWIIMFTLRLFRLSREK